MACLRESATPPNKKTHPLQPRARPLHHAPLLKACAKRIEGKPDAHCTGQYFDMWACIDKCVSSKLFPLLK